MSEKISSNKKNIEEFLYLGYAKWDVLIGKIRKQESKKAEDYINEQVWTFIVACGYAIAGPVGLRKLCEILTHRTDLSTEKIWFEVLPSSLRSCEGATHLDLAVGDIKKREGTVSGIELVHKENSWISFCEMKWRSDISYNVSYDLQRNQLARVIDNALLFEKENKFAKNVFVNLITPEIFKNSGNKSRLYNYKYDEYQENEKLENDLKNCNLDYRNKENISKISERIPALVLEWTTFDSLFHSMPESDISEEIKEFERKFNKAK